jgi:hypothetical protein
MRGLQVLGIAALAAIVTAGGAAAEPARSSHLRGLTPAGRELITEALERSVIIRGLVDALERTDVVVYVTLDLIEHQNQSGYLSFLSSAGGVRYVVVKIDWRAIGPHRIATLGHELQHALEVASAPQVRDVRTFAAFYREIGWRTGGGKYETDLARETGRRVELELAGFRRVM